MATRFLFYARRLGSAPIKPKKKAKEVQTSRSECAGLIEGLRSLGLASITAADASKALTELFPCGTVEMDDGEVLRAVFLHLKRKNSAGKVR
jgi:hypothetical protein